MPDTAVTAGVGRMQTLHLVLLYLGIALLGSFEALNSGLMMWYLLLLYVGSVAATWTVTDARLRGRFIPQSYGVFLWMFWPWLVPAYLVWSRGFLGIGLCVLHLLGLAITYLLGFGLAAGLLH